MHLIETRNELSAEQLRTLANNWLKEKGKCPEYITSEGLGAYALMKLTINVPDLKPEDYSILNTLTVH